MEREKGRAYLSPAGGGVLLILIRSRGGSGRGSLGAGAAYDGHEPRMSLGTAGTRKRATSAGIIRSKRFDAG